MDSNDEALWYDADDTGKSNRKESRIRLDSRNESDEDSEDDEIPVMDLKDDSEDSDEAESDDEMGEEELTGLAGKMVRQAKLMKQKAGMEDEEVEEEEEKEKTAWGRGKKIYYNADNVDFELQSSDEEAPAEEEEEARRLQQQMAASLRPEDYEVDESESEDEKDDGEETLEEAAERLERKSKKNSNKEDKFDADAPPIMEHVKKDISALSKAEQMELLMSDAPELVGLTTELRENLDELRIKVLPLLEKAEARSVRDHPVIGRLVDLKRSLERLRPIDQKLQKQMERLLKAGNSLERDAVNEEEVGAKGESGLPQLSTKRVGQKKELSRKRKSHAEGLADGEIGRLEKVENVLGADSIEMMRERARLDARTQEDNYSAHVPVSKTQCKKFKRQKEPHLGLTRMVDDLEDNLGNDDAGFSGKQRTLSQVIAEAGRPFKQPKILSGDADLPAREDLGERRRKYEIQQSNKEAAMEDGEESGRDDNVEPDEDAFYKQARLLKEAKEGAKLAKYSRTPIAPAEEDDADGKRHITYQMEKNRGLTPRRNKANKNPRKKYKLKHEKAVIRRKGQVREVRIPSTSYGGESTGINKNISRSVRFQN